MRLGIKHIITSNLAKLGITFVFSDIRSQIVQMRAPEIPAELLKNCKVFPSRKALPSHLPKGGVIAEVGVAYGDFTELLLSALEPRHFVAIDSFGLRAHHEPSWGRSRLEESGMTHREFFDDRFSKLISAGKMDVKQGLSWDMLATFPDEHFDYIYLDADHSYQSVVTDIAQIHKKIKPDGLLQFNDYTNIDPFGLEAYGVRRAVTEFMLRERYEMLAFCLEPDGFCDVLLKKSLK